MKRIFFFLGLLVISLNSLFAQNHNYRVGDRGPAGGWVFYDKGEYSDGWRFLEAATGDCEKKTSFGTKWGKNNNPISGADHSEIGYGEENNKGCLMHYKLL